MKITGIVIGLFLMCGACFADGITKYSDDSIQVTQSVTNVIKLEDLNKLRANLSNDIERKQAEIVLLQNQIERLDATILSAENLGVKVIEKREENE